MGGYEDPTPEDLEASRGARQARKRLDQLEISTHYLQHAARLRAEANLPEDVDLDALIGRAHTECLDLREKCGGWIESRRRPRKKHASGPLYNISIDECGSHVVGASDGYGAFVLAATIVRADEYPVFDQRWRAWKSANLGSDTELVHEPDVRRNRKAFRSADVVEALPEIIGELDFSAVAVVINRADYVDAIGLGPLDESLPSHAYMMALDFLVERLAFALDDHFDGAKGGLIAESRGPKEDAMLQHEFARLQLEGTSYVHRAGSDRRYAQGSSFSTRRRITAGYSSQICSPARWATRSLTPPARQIGGQRSATSFALVVKRRTRSWG